MNALVLSMGDFDDSNSLRRHYWTVHEHEKVVLKREFERAIADSRDVFLRIWPLDRTIREMSVGLAAPVRRRLARWLRPDSQIRVGIDQGSESEHIAVSLTVFWPAARAQYEGMIHVIERLELGGSFTVSEFDLARAV